MELSEEIICQCYRNFFKDQTVIFNTYIFVWLHLSYSISNSLAYVRSYKQMYNILAMIYVSDSNRDILPNARITCAVIFNGPLYSP